MDALHYIVDDVLQLRNVRCVRIAHGVQYLHEVPNIPRSIFMWWTNDIQNHFTLDADSYTSSLRTYDVVGTQWKETKETKYLQFLISSGTIDLSSAVEELQEDSVSDTSSRADASGGTHTTDPDGLSTIPEEVEGQFYSNPSQCPEWCDAEQWQQLEEQQQKIFQPLQDFEEFETNAIDDVRLEAAPRADLPTCDIDDKFAIYHTFGADSEEYGKLDIDDRKSKIVRRKSLRKM